ncbi:MAG: N-acetyltransferase [bacterium]|nr:N-acetyltransferase [bacterium]
MAEIELLNGVAEVPKDDWNALVGDQSPFLEWDFLASLEQADCVGDTSGWSARPLVARENGRVVAACPLYLKSHSEGEFVFDWNWADAAERAGISYYPKLLVGIPFTPVGGTRFLVASDQDRTHWVSQLGHALLGLCEDNDLSGVHVLFCAPEEVEPLERLGFELRIGVQYHWLNEGYADFNEYLSRFRSKRRNQIKRERRGMVEEGIEIEALTGDEITPDLIDPMYEFYCSTVNTRMWGRQYLNRKLFELLIERSRHRLCFIVARQKGQIIAGTTNVQKGDALYGRYWGTRQDVRYLHFNVCYYAAVEHCIRHGLKRFEPGAGGEYKQTRGFDGQPTYSLHFLREPRLRQAVSRFLSGERDHMRDSIEWLHENSVLKPNEVT